MLSGVQPTGTVHLGNYLGAIANWVRLQDLYGAALGTALLRYCTVSSLLSVLPPLDLAGSAVVCALADTFFTIVDLHAITMPHEPVELLAATRRTAALYLAAGIDPAKSAIFVQSHVPAHAELAWLLQCYAPIGWLRKMIQFKEKSRKQVLPGSGPWADS